MQKSPGRASNKAEAENARRFRRLGWAKTFSDFLFFPLEIFCGFSKSYFRRGSIMRLRRDTQCPAQTEVAWAPSRSSHLLERKEEAHGASAKTGRSHPLRHPRRMGSKRFATSRSSL